MWQKECTTVEQEADVKRAEKWMMLRGTEIKE